MTKSSESVSKSKKKKNDAIKVQIRSNDGGVVKVTMVKVTDGDSGGGGPISDSIQQSDQYKQQMERFKKQEEEHEKLFKIRMAAKQSQLEHIIAEQEQRTKLRMNVEVVKKKKLADEEVEKKIKELRDEFHSKAEELRVKGQERIKKMLEEKKSKLEQLKQKTIELFTKELEARRQQLDMEVERLQRPLIRDDLADMREFQKKIMVELKMFKDTPRLADEYALRSKYGATRQQKAVNTNNTCVLYHGKIAGIVENCLVKVVVINNRPVAYRKMVDKTTKIYRFLTKDTPPEHPALIKVYEIFYTDQKIFTFMQECDPVNLLDRSRKPGAISADKLKNVIEITASALEYLHKRAFAHLKIRPESIIFDKENKPKLVGFGNVSAYFDRETAQYRKVDRMDRWNRIQDNHLPKEVFRGPFDPEPVDVYSLGAMLHLIFVIISKKIKDRKELIRTSTLIDLSKISDEKVKGFIAKCIKEDPAARPKISQLKDDPYLKGDDAVAE